MGHRRRVPRRPRQRLDAVRSVLAAEAGRRTDEAKRWARTGAGSPAEGRARSIAVGCKRIGTMLGDVRLRRSGGIGVRGLAALRAKDLSRWLGRRGERGGPWAALVTLHRVRWGRALLAGSAENPQGGLTGRRRPGEGRSRGTGPIPVTDASRAIALRSGLESRRVWHIAA